MKAIVYFVPIFILISCKKKVEDPNILIAGESTQVTSLGTSYTVSGMIGTPKEVSLDLNNDGIKDVSLYSAWKLASGTNLTPILTLSTLHDDIGIRVATSMDSLYRLEVNNFQIRSDGHHEYFNTVRVSCNRESINYYPFGTRVKTEVIGLPKGGSFAKTDYFESGEFFLAEPDFGTAESMTNADSTFYTFYKETVDCGRFTTNQVRYIPFKMSTSNGEKLGWLEVMYFGTNRIRVRDWAIQN